MLYVSSGVAADVDCLLLLLSRGVHLRSKYSIIKIVYYVERYLYGSHFFDSTPCIRHLMFHQDRRRVRRKKDDLKLNSFIVNSSISCYEWCFRYFIVLLLLLLLLFLFFFRWKFLHALCFFYCYYIFFLFLFI